MPQEPNIYTRPSSLSTRTMPTGYVPARLLERIEQPNYEFMGFSGESDLAAGIEVGSINSETYSWPWVVQN